MMDVVVDTLPALMAALAAAEGGARIEIAAGDYAAPAFTELDFETAVIVTSADPGDPAVFRGATSIVGSRNLVLADVALAADGAMKDPVLSIVGSSGVVVDGVTVTGHVPGPEGADPHAGSTGRVQPIAGFPYGDGVQVSGAFDITLSDTEITDVRRALAVFDARDVSLEGLKVHGVREGLNLYEVTGLRLVDSHFHDFVRWLPEPDYDSAIHDHVDMVQYWGRRSKTGVHDITIARNLFEQPPGTRSQTIFGHLGKAPDDVTAGNFTIADNIILNASPNAIRLGGVVGGSITGNVLLPNAADVAHSSAPRINLTGGASDIVVRDNVMVRPRGPRTLINRSPADLAGIGVVLDQNLLLSMRPGDPLYWATWKARHLDPVLPGLRR